MSHGAPEISAPIEVPVVPGPVGVLVRAMNLVNRLVMGLGGIALVAAALVLSYSVVVRYFLKIPTDWQDETAVFLLVGATFMSGAAVQARRGHVGIEAFASIMSPRANRWRMLFTDIASAAFCAFFSWKSFTLLHEAWVDDQHSSSTWGPPLWIPYSVMAIGMTLLTLQIIIQIAVALDRRNHA
ncbi:C4-dicarboxylate ABC transporter [Alsobacter metallidurans]|uniref:TRAP transporter small permease protein n=1 Tax=Alsobacter metallidurans TaxID=340221 RepID=A0A917I3D9_9HYPH|nr:TRAP transporter small permease [Alsobacter metallidurans]GGH08204.1 C4-dicarboxylate ABC transporter [Alsobacter metallidurans]